ncbi:MAG TPA: elongation factor G [Epulopiscium sp.]|nr:elongation factor G [Candidatus Epulonipiscium sp.]
MKKYNTGQIRNVVLMGHGGAGKTTLAEAVLRTTGTINRRGTIESGNTVSDYDPEEIKRKFSIKTSVIPVEWKEHKINILDAPGYDDFTGEVEQALRIADTAVIVINAASGLEIGAQKAWKFAADAGLPRMIYITGMDLENANMPRILKELKQRYGNSIAPMQVPWYEDGKFVGYIDIVRMVGRRYVGKQTEDCDLPEGMDDLIIPARTMILEAVAETNEVLMEKYFADEEISADEITDAIRDSVIAGTIVPVFCGAGTMSAGITILLNSLIRYCPSPEILHQENFGRDETGENEVLRKCEATDKTSLFVFKTIVDPFIGRFTFFKVRSGTVKADDVLYNARTKEAEKLSRIYVFRGKEQIEVDELVAGDIGAVAKLKDTVINDTLYEKDAYIQYPPIVFPIPYLKRAIFPRGKGDEEKLSGAIQRLMSEDPTFYTEYDVETRETVIYGMGQQQLDIIVNMLKSKFKVEVDLKMPTTRYRETIKGSAQVRGRHKKQSGGHGQFGDVVMAFEPLGDLSVPFVFEEKVFGGSVPRQYFPAVEKGLEESVQKGVLAGYPVVGIKATLVEGSYHPVDSSEMAFKIATTVAFKNGMEKATPIILEPIAYAEITIPDEYTGDIMGDMKKRRGRMLGMELNGSRQVIIAEVPMAEMYNYPTDLRSLTQGRGEVMYRFERYDEASSEVQEQVIADRAEDK